MSLHPRPFICILFLLQFSIVGKTNAQLSPSNSDSRLNVLAPALTNGGPSGGLTIPDGRILPDGDVVLGINNYVDPQYRTADGYVNYLFGIGLFPYFELSGRITNYTEFDEENYLARDLSANVKATVPKIFNWQPDIAFGSNDMGGGAKHFHSNYVTASEEFGFIYGTVGLAHGQSYLNGLLAGIEIPLGNSGLSLLGERNNHADDFGFRYASKPFPMFGNARVVATAQHSYQVQASDGSKFDRTTLGVSIVIPFGSNARNVKMPETVADVVWTPPTSYRANEDMQKKELARAQEPVPASVWTPPPGYETGRPGAPTVAEKSSVVSENPVASPSMAAEEFPTERLEKLRALLGKAGLERVRVGVTHSKLVIEYENHRYNQNEVDALGIALGLGARMAPDSIERISVITKKADLPLYEMTVGRQAFQRFIDSGDKYEVREGLDVITRPIDDPLVQWLDKEEGKRGYSRVLLTPLFPKFVATEIGIFDYSLAMSVDGLVPLWKGAEFSGNYVQRVSESSEVRDGVFNYAHQASGFKSVTLNQAFWVTDNVLDVISAGKFNYDFAGVQNQMTILVPHRDDQIILQYSKIRESQPYEKVNETSGAAFYRWIYQPLDTWVEAGYSKYVEGDRGPTLSVNRWFGDIEAQAYFLRSNVTNFIGFQLSFPLTPRQGMQPGISHIEGTSDFSLGLRTVYAHNGQCNCIVNGIAQEIPIGYSTSDLLLNEGRIGKTYFISQLPRMREALLLFTTVD
jgi:hypothetical protein